MRPRLSLSLASRIPQVDRGRRFRSWLCCCLALGAACAIPLQARDVFVLVSGGDSPFENHYSQYLQARAVATWLHQSYPPDSVWIFFGAGNVTGQPPRFGDVHRVEQHDTLALESWIPGELPRNRPAKRAVILRALREEILPAVADGGTLFLFVGDHGSRPDGDDAESIINLWSLDRDPRSEHGWRSNEQETLGVSELRQLLAQHLGQGRVVFCMTQCHSGGFHNMAVPRAVHPNPKWFVHPAQASQLAPPPPLPRAAGFTATDEFSPAAGCDPAPTAQQWAGYERYFPEHLLGLDMFSLRSVRKPSRSFHQAHIQATFADTTIDLPLSTSDHYLLRWADLIETRLATETGLNKTIRKHLDAYQRTVNGATFRASHEALREHQALLHRFIERLTQQNPDTKDLLLTGTRHALEKAIDPDNDDARRAQNSTREVSDPPPRRDSRRGRSSERRKLWTETLRPAWQAAVESRQVPDLTGPALPFETHLLAQEATGRDLFFNRRGALSQEIFWHSGYSDPETLDPARAQAIARWGAERRAKIVTWAQSAPDETLRDAAQKLAPTPNPRSSRTPASPPGLPGVEPIPRKTAVARTLSYRRILAAWQFLLAVNERSALARVRELMELERTPLPAPKP